MTVRMGMIGCGWMAEKHLKGLIELHEKNVEYDLAAFCDPHEERAAMFARTFRDRTGKDSIRS